MSALRSAFASVSRVARTASAPRQAFVARPAVAAWRVQQQRGYAAAAGLSKEAIETRVLDVLKSFEKVKPEKVCAGMISDIWTSAVG